MALGKAFIEVHADTKPFARELEKELTRLTKAAESGNLKATGRKLGQSLADGIGEGVEKSRSQVGRSIKKTLDGVSSDGSVFSRFAKGIVDSIDDGLSGLPAEIKVALGAALLAVTPFIGSSIASVIAAALILGFAGIGTLLAFQFERVRLAGAGMVTFLRNLFVTAAAGFIEPVLAGIRTIEQRFAGMAPTFTRIFDLAATFIEPLTEGLVGFFEQLLPGLEESLVNAADLVDTLAFHFKFLGRIIGEALAIITGADNLDDALNDFLTAVETIILMGAILIRVLTEIYAIMKTIISIAAPLLTLAGAFERVEHGAKGADKGAGGFRSTIDDLIAPTTAEEQALKAINDQLTAFTTNTGNAWQSNINFEKSLDDTAEILKKNKGELNLNTRAGQANQQALLNTSQALIKQREDYITLGGTVANADKIFKANIARLEEQANKAGISDQAFRDLTGAILAVPPPITTGVTPESTQSVTAAIIAWNSLRAAIIRANNAARNAPIGSIPLGRMRGYADGGVITSPTVGLIGEAGPEAIIPLSNPARAAQVMNEAGLTGGGANVTVYIGNQQINAYIDSRVDKRMNLTARTMAYGSRNV